MRSQRMSDFKTIKRQAHALPAEDRVRLAESLLESVRAPAVAEIEASWDAEIEERVAAFGRGDLETHLAQDVFAEARRITR